MHGVRRIGKARNTMDEFYVSRELTSYEEA
jgi:hypothetical protein